MAMRVRVKKGKGWAKFSLFVEGEGGSVEIGKIAIAEPRLVWRRAGKKRYVRWELPAIPFSASRVVVLPLDAYAEIVRAWEVLEAYRYAVGYLKALVENPLSREEIKLSGRLT